MNRADLSRFALAVTFVVAGLLHFAKPQAYQRIVPPPLPAPAAVLWSGAAEIAGGLGLLLPSTRRAASWGLVALLLAVWPANVWMALYAERFAPLPAWALWLRVPLQLPLLWWAWWAGRPEPAPGIMRP